MKLPLSPFNRIPKFFRFRLLGLVLVFGMALNAWSQNQNAPSPGTPVLTPESVLGRKGKAIQDEAQQEKDPSNEKGSVASPTPDLLSQYESETGTGAKLKRWLGRLGFGGSAAHQGNKAYQAGDFDEALRHYGEGLLDAPESQLLQYNAGNAQFRKRKYEEAIANYRKALIGDNAGLSSKAWYNLGNSYFRKGEFALQQGQQEGISDYREALAAYKKSLEIRSENKDAKQNIEVVQARIKELLERQKQDQQKLKRTRTDRRNNHLKHTRHHESDRSRPTAILSRINNRHHSFRRCLVFSTSIEWEVARKLAQSTAKIPFENCQFLLKTGAKIFNLCGKTT